MTTANTSRALEQGASRRGTASDREHGGSIGGVHDDGSGGAAPSGGSSSHAEPVGEPQNLLTESAVRGGNGVPAESAVHGSSSSGSAAVGSGPPPVEQPRPSAGGDTIDCEAANEHEPAL